MFSNNYIVNETEDIFPQQTFPASFECDDGNFQTILNINILSSILDLKIALSNKLNVDRQYLFIENLGERLNNWVQIFDYLLLDGTDKIIIKLFSQSPVMVKYNFKNAVTNLTYLKL